MGRSRGWPWPEATTSSKLEVNGPAPVPHDRRARPAHGRGDVGAALLRGARADQVGAHAGQPAPLPALRGEARLGDTRRPALRHLARRGGRDAGAAAGGPHAHGGRLGGARQGLAAEPRRAHRHAGGPARPALGVHRLRLPLPRPLLAGEPGRRGGPRRAGAALPGAAEGRRLSARAGYFPKMFGRSSLVTRTARGLLPVCGPTMPRASSESMSLPAPAWPTASRRCRRETLAWPSLTTSSAAARSLSSFQSTSPLAVDSSAGGGSKSAP